MSRTALRKMPRVSLLACALATASLPLMAQNVGSSTRFTPVIGDSSTLYPRSLTTTDTPPEVVAARSGEVDYSRNAGVDRVSVEVDRDGVPADGQTPVHITVHLLGADAEVVKDADGTLIGTIRFNPSDIGLAGRMEEARAKIAEIMAAPVTGPEDLVEWDRQVRHWFDYIFGTPVSDVFFAGVSSLAFCEDGSLVAEAVLDAVTPMLTQAVEAAAKASAARIARHADAYQGSTAGLAPEQQ